MFNKSLTILLAFLLCAGLKVAILAQDKQEAKKDEPKKEDARVLDTVGGSDEVTLEGKSQKLLIKSITGSAKVDCGKLDVEEIEIEMLAGSPEITLKLPDKAKLKKLIIRNMNGSPKLNAAELDVAQIEIGTASGSPELKLQASGDITIKSASGSPKITITHCRNVTVGSVSGSPAISASYFGNAEVPEKSNINLKKIEPPKSRQGL